LELLKTEANVSFYLEYCSIPSSLPRMMADIAGFAWADFLDLEMANVWLGNGRTLGKLHFDPFDNLLCQICTSSSSSLASTLSQENLI
jgi:jumonji domain-containing protein 7